LSMSAWNHQDKKTNQLSYTSDWEELGTFSLICATKVSMDRTLVLKLSMYLSSSATGWPQELVNGWVFGTIMQCPHATPFLLFVYILS